MGAHGRMTRRDAIASPPALVGGILAELAAWQSRPMAYRIVETCIGCTACKNRCPTDAISGDRKALHAVDPRLCIDCGACGVVCPSGAILDDRGVATVMLKKPQRPRAFVDELAC